MSLLSRSFAIAATFSAGLFAPVTSFAAGYDVRVIADQNQIAPGTNNKGKFDIFEIPLIGSKISKVGMIGYLIRGVGGVTSQNDAGIWAENAKTGALTLVARTGSAAPGTNGKGLFTLFQTNPIYNNLGGVAFAATLRGSGVTTDNDDGIWATDKKGVLTLCARSLGAAPGLPKGTLFEVLTQKSDPVYNNLGQIGFYADLKLFTGDVVSFPDNSDALFFGYPGSIKVIARRGSLAEGTPAGVKYGSGTFSGININDVGQVAFSSQLMFGEGGVTGDNDIAVFGGKPGAITMRARKGTKAPGTNIKFAYFNGGNDPVPVINAKGKVAFRATLDVFDDAEGIWSEGIGSSLALVAKQGGAAAGITGGTYSTFSHFTLSNTGQIAFTARLKENAPKVTINTDEVVYLQNATGTLVPIAREGQKAPGLPQNTIFAGNFTTPIVNAAGDCLFVATVSGPSIGSADNIALFSRKKNGTITPVIRNKDVITLGPGDSRIVDFFYYNSNSNPGQAHSISFNENGRIGLLLACGDGTDVPVIFSPK